MDTAVADQWPEDSAQPALSGRKFFFKTDDKVLATYRDLQTLRYCSNLIKSKPNGKILILGPWSHKHREFLINTLLHLGVSCGQIVEFNKSMPQVPDSSGVWLLVAD